MIDNQRDTQRASGVIGCCWSFRYAEKLGANIIDLKENQRILVSSMCGELWSSKTFFVTAVSEKHI